MDISTFQQKIRGRILELLRPCVSSDYVLLDVPHFGNVGDVMIWQASLELLRNIGQKCRYSCSIETYRKERIAPGNILVFMGGGNFGDLWERHQAFRHRVMADFPNNPIIQLPQSVWFDDYEKMEADVVLFKRHRAPVTIFLRDQQSLDIIRQSYTNVQACLMPDLALSLDVHPFQNMHTDGNGSLLVDRQDKERLETGERGSVPEDVAVADWPSIHNGLPGQLRLSKIQRWMQKCRLSPWMPAWTNWYYSHVLRQEIIKSGVDFISPYSKVYSTRLHAAVLAALLGKQVYMLDNSYGKCKGVFDLWMKDLDNVTLL